MALLTKQQLSLKIRYTLIDAQFAWRGLQAEEIFPPEEISLNSQKTQAAGGVFSRSSLPGRLP